MVLLQKVDKPTALKVTCKKLWAMERKGKKDRRTLSIFSKSV